MTEERNMFQTVGFRFLICNLLIAGMIGTVMLIQRCAHTSISGRTRYFMWKLMLGVLFIPFIPVPAKWIKAGLPARMAQVLQALLTGLFSGSDNSSDTAAGEISEQAGTVFPSSEILDYAVPEGSSAPSAMNLILMCIWGIGVSAGIIWIVRSYLKIRALERASVPVTDARFRKIFAGCLEETGLQRTLPVSGTAFLKTPVLAGIIKPRICFPIRLIKDENTETLRYMLLHELCHYRRRDNLYNLLMSVAAAVYWFNPAVHLMRRRIEADREAACDESVLMMLDESEYVLYGYTLLDAAAGVSGSPAPFTAGIGAGIKEMRKRIENIAGYRPSTRRQKMKNGVLILMTAAVLLSGIPALPVFAGTDDVQAGQDIFSDDNVRYIDLSEEMYGYEGTFVLYDEASDEWIVYNEENAMTRISPLSTWKIYDALLGLECGVIAPDDSARQWNGEPWPFDTWERDQDLDSAMEDSVNWYFQSLDREAGRAKISTFLAQIGYGNETVGAGITDYWLDSSLKVSPAEQVVQLKKLFRNEYGFRQENVDAVKNAICLSSAPEGKFYGKTGTARADGEDVNGWFIGAVENAKGDSYSYFAVNIQANTGASGSRAAEIAGDVLAYLGVCQRPVTPSTVSVT